MNNGLYVDLPALADAGLYLKESGLIVDDMLTQLDEFANLANQAAWNDQMGITFAENFSKFIFSARSLSNTISEAGKTINSYTGHYNGALQKAVSKMKSLG